MKRGYRLILPVLAALLMTSCESRPISQQLVVASMGVDTSVTPWQAVLEIMQEENNKFYFVSGSSFAEISARAERRYGYPLYWGAMECVLFSGVESHEQLRELLLTLNREPQVGANTQIALCEDATELISEKTGGADFSSLLTGQYTRSNDYSLVTVLDALLGDDGGILLPVVDAAQEIPQITGYLPSNTMNYSAPWGGNALLGLMTARHDEQTVDLIAAGSTASIRIQDYCQSGLRFDADGGATVTVTLTATVLDVQNAGIRRDLVKKELEKEMLRQLEEIRNIVAEQGNTDLFRCAWYARWWGYTRIPDAQNISFQIKLNFQDPKELLRE